MTTHSLSTTTKFVLIEALAIGAASLIVGKVNLITACLVGGAYTLVKSVTAPFFNHQSGILSFLFNTALTTGLVNHFSSFHLLSTEVAYITFLPLIAVTKIIMVGLAGILLVSIISACYQHTADAFRDFFHSY